MVLTSKSLSNTSSKTQADQEDFKGFWTLLKLRMLQKPDERILYTLALTCLDRGYVQKEMGWPLWPGRLPLNDPFLASLL